MNKAPTVSLVTPPPSTDASMRALSSWSWLLPRRVAPVAVNRFGDWYLSTPDGAIHLLSIWEGKFTPVAPSEAAWRIWLASDYGQNANWVELVLVLYGRGQRLGDDQCFAFVPPPLDGVGIDVERIKTFSLVAITSVMGQTFQQRG